MTSTYDQTRPGLAEDGENIRRSGRQDVWPAAVNPAAAPSRSPGIETSLFDAEPPADAPPAMQFAAPVAAAEVTP